MIQPGQIYRSCDPRESIRIRITAYRPGDARAQVVDAVTGKRFRQILVQQLHESPVTATGRRRRTGYVLDSQAPAGEAPEGPQERPEGGSASIASSEPLTGAQVGADSLGLREVIAGAIWDATSTHPDAIADAVYTRLKPHLAPHYQRAVDAATAAEAKIARVRAVIAERRTEVAEREVDGMLELGTPGASWCDAVTVTCNRIDDALREFPPPAAVPAEPAHNAGPTVAECAEADRRWPLQKHGE